MSGDPKTCVVIVGIDEYPELGLHSLRGAVNDAAAWWQYFVFDLGIEPGDVTVLTRPKLEVDELARRAAPIGDRGAVKTILAAADSRLREASTDTIAEALATAASNAEDGSSRSMVVWSGHGSRIGTEQAGDDEQSSHIDVLVVPGTTSKDQQSGPSLWQVANADDESSSTNNIHFLVDACFGNPIGAPNARLAEASVLKAAAPLLDSPNKLLAQSAVWISAATGDLPASEIQLNGRWRGAFSLASQTVLSRWIREVPAGYLAFAPRVSADKLAYRTNRVVAAMNPASGQEAEVRRHVDSPLFAPAATAIAPIQEPTRHAHHRQIWAGDDGNFRVYDIALVVQGNLDPARATAVATNEPFQTVVGRTDGRNRAAFAANGEYLGYQSEFADRLYASEVHLDASLTWTLEIDKATDAQANLCETENAPLKPYHAKGRIRFRANPREWNVVDGSIHDESHNRLFKCRDLPGERWAVRLHVEGEPGARRITKVTWYQQAANPPTETNEPSLKSLHLQTNTDVQWTAIGVAPPYQDGWAPESGMQWYSQEWADNGIHAAHPAGC